MVTVHFKNVQSERAMRQVCVDDLTHLTSEFEWVNSFYRGWFAFEFLTHFVVHELSFDLAHFSSEFTQHCDLWRAFSWLRRWMSLRIASWSTCTRLAKAALDMFITRYIKTGPKWPTRNLWSTLLSQTKGERHHRYHHRQQHNHHHHHHYRHYCCYWYRIF